MTPTYTETLGKVGAVLPLQPRSDGSGIHIVAAHEPLPGEAVPLPNPEMPVNPLQEKPSGVAKKRARRAAQEAQPEMTQPLPVTPAPEPQVLRVALVGTAPSSRLLAPFHDPAWTIWACSPGNMNALPRVDVWFEIHGNLHWPENAHYGRPYVEWLSKLNIPLYMQNQLYCPNALTFPYEEMIAEFGKDFFTSSFAWMMAKAIKDGAKEIALFGIDMASRDEYILQRPGFYFFKHIAEQRGIRVWAPNESDIMQPPGLYGFSEVKPFGRKILARKQELKSRITDMRTQRDKLNHDIAYLEGAIEDLDYIETIWMGQS